MGVERLVPLGVAVALGIGSGYYIFNDLLREEAAKKHASSPDQPVQASSLPKLDKPAAENALKPVPPHEEGNKPTSQPATSWFWKR